MESRIRDTAVLLLFATVMLSPVTMEEIVSTCGPQNPCGTGFRCDDTDACVVGTAGQLQADRGQVCMTR